MRGDIPQEVREKDCEKGFSELLFLMLNAGTSLFICTICCLQLTRDWTKGDAGMAQNIRNCCPCPSPPPSPPGQRGGGKAEAELTSPMEGRAGRKPDQLQSLDLSSENPEKSIFYA